MRYYGYMDMEMTCDGIQENGRFIDDGRFPLYEREIISVGLVIAGDNYEVQKKYHAFIKPVLHPAVSDYCRNLTGIQQKDVNNAEDCGVVFDEILQMCRRYSVSAIYVFGNGDVPAITNNARIRRKMNMDSRSMLTVRNKLIDIRPAILARMHLKKRGNGLKRLAEYLNVECTHQHNALYDAKMLMEICHKTL